jgi:putative glutamine amidotransferase
MSAPLIGLSGRRWPAASIPKFDYAALAGEEVDVHLSEYPKALAQLGALPVQLNRNVDPAGIASRLDGLVMTGGADPDPALYGAEPHPLLGDVERGRDDWELALIRAALAARLPMLCVCRGAQLLNVALGGTLVQHLDEADTHALWATHRATRCHVVAFAPGSQAATLYGDERATNSLHHQAVERPGDGVVVTGRTDDGVIESFEVTGRPEVFAVQWHPEMLADQPDPAFRWLVDQARATRHT